MASNEYLSEVQKYTPQVAHHWPKQQPREFGAAMLAALSNPDRQTAIAAAVAAGVPADLAPSQFETFCRARLERSRDPEPLATRHSGHAGSLRHMRFGKIVSDSLGLPHPVWGALMCPTGGMAGSGNQRLGGWLGPNNFLILHASAHDAYGYLRTFHEVGPGYNYRGRRWLADTNPLAGQFSGLWYWLWA